MQAAQPLLENLGVLPQRLEVVDADDQRTIFLNGYPAARYGCDDKAAERVLLTELAEVLPLPDRQIAAAFQIHPVTLSRFRSLARRGGAAALIPRKTGPQGPTKMTPKLEARCRALRAEGVSLRAIAQKVSNKRLRISHVTVAALFNRPSAQTHQEALLLEQPTPEQEQQEQEEVLQPPEAPTGAPSLPSYSPLTSQGEPAVESVEISASEGEHTRYAGAMMLYAALGQLGLWEALCGLGANAGPNRRFEWMQIVASIVFCFALRFRSIEDWKNGLRRDLGVLIGEPASPSVLSLRLRIKALAESVDPAALSREMFQRYLALEPVWEGLYYVDGHFCSY